MSLSTRKGSILGNSYLKSLNPDAVEFVPFSHKPSPGSTSTADIRSSHQSSRSETMGKSVLDRSESSISDDEVHRYWRQQLPDDIIPDFNLMAQEEPQVINDLPFANLSLQENHELPRFSASSGSRFIMKDQVELPLRSSAPSYVDDVSSANLFHLPTKPWDDPVLKNDQLPSTSNEGSLHNGSFALRRPTIAPPDRATVEVPNVSPFELLTLQFPTVSTDSLAELYFSNGCDLNLTFEALNQRELQGERRISDPIFGMPDYPSLAAGAESPPGRYSTSGEETLAQPLVYRRAHDRAALASTSALIRNMLSHDSNIGRYDRNASTDATGGSSYPHLFGQARGTTGDGFQIRTSPRAAPSWMETGDAVVGNLYAETREEARDHARLRNAYFEQARQAYYIGNKVLAKEMSMKGQLHNLHMKAAHGKVQESLLRQRNNEMMMQYQHQHQQLNAGRVHERLIDLQGLQANEAVHILNRELTLLKLAARADEQRVQVYICVGTINQTRGVRATPARLPIVVQRYLLEEEGLDFTEPQPGLLRVVIR
ncbi:polyadenylate-binding protein-interacting protein 7-like isoform X2 [Impatiens glandulifera]|uniref:polyadenylate-binding protein-interacting protein 7-like isoform X2 n=1 Tax=Impatiens glandulifera TaxID=253017 RepID=UPI001FB0E257|nr:polyadenylate-binding protein-interacting protein 7-like isoform X2 [Impatiens glandulifera]